MFKGETRILTPKEYNRLRDGLLKPHHKIMFDGLLYTGMRLEEFWRFIDHIDWFSQDRMCIHLPKGSSLKVKAKMQERDVNLSSLGTRVVRDLIDAIKRGDVRKVSNRAWNDLLKRAAMRAKFNPKGFTPKTTRKTWTSWLMSTYPEDGLRIAANAGHDTATMQKHYMNTPFSPEERTAIKMHVQGWNGRT